MSRSFSLVSIDFQRRRQRRRDRLSPSEGREDAAARVLRNFLDRHELSEECPMSAEVAEEESEDHKNCTGSRYREAA